MPQFIVNEWQQLLGGVWVAMLNGGQDSSDFAHGDEHNASTRRQQSISH